jgi:hypothetical protein
MGIGRRHTDGRPRSTGLLRTVKSAVTGTSGRPSWQEHGHRGTVRRRRGATGPVGSCPRVLLPLVNGPGTEDSAPGPFTGAIAGSSAVSRGLGAVTARSYGCVVVGVVGAVGAVGGVGAVGLVGGVGRTRQ